MATTLDDTKQLVGDITSAGNSGILGGVNPLFTNKDALDSAKGNVTPATTAQSWYQKELAMVKANQKTWMIVAGVVVGAIIAYLVWKHFKK